MPSPFSTSASSVASASVPVVGSASSFSPLSVFTLSGSSEMASGSDIASGIGLSLAVLFGSGDFGFFSAFGSVSISSAAFPWLRGLHFQMFSHLLNPRTYYR